MLFPLLPSGNAMEVCSSRHVVMNIRRALLMWKVPTGRCWAKVVLKVFFFFIASLETLWTKFVDSNYTKKTDSIANPHSAQMWNVFK
jgi:hypothetical protein